MTQDLQTQLRPIASRQNARLKALRRALTQAQLTEDGECALEGEHLVTEAIRSGLKIRTVFFSERANPSMVSRLTPQFGKNTELLQLPSDIFASVVETESPQGVAALAVAKQFKPEQLLSPAPPLIVVAAGVQDPGNLGAIQRSAEAFGATGMICCKGAVSPYNAKSMRASVGSCLRLPTVRMSNEEAIHFLNDAGITACVASSHKGEPVDEAELTGPLALVIGNEGAGAPSEFLKAAERRLCIPQSPRVESLNAGMAASILLYEVSRQRRKAAEL